MRSYLSLFYSWSFSFYLPPSKGKELLDAWEAQGGTRLNRQAMFHAPAGGEDKDGSVVTIVKKPKKAKTVEDGKEKLVTPTGLGKKKKNAEVEQEGTDKKGKRNGGKDKEVGTKKAKDPSEKIPVKKKKVEAKEKVPVTKGKEKPTIKVERLETDKAIQVKKDETPEKAKSLDRKDKKRERKEDGIDVLDVEVELDADNDKGKGKEEADDADGLEMNQPKKPRVFRLKPEFVHLIKKK